MLIDFCLRGPCSDWITKLPLRRSSSEIHFAHTCSSVVGGLPQKASVGSRRQVQLWQVPSLLIGRHPGQVLRKLDLLSFQAMTSFRNAVTVCDTQKEESRLKDPVDVRRERDQRLRVQSEDHRTVPLADEPTVWIASWHDPVAAAQAR